MNKTYVLNGMGMNKQLRLVDKYYNFRCPVCGQICRTITEKELKKYLRTWNLLQMRHLSSKEIEEYVDLSNHGYQYIDILCVNPACEGEFEWIITNFEQFQECAAVCVEVVCEVCPCSEKSVNNHCYRIN